MWFAAAWQLTSQKHGVSALGLQRVLGLGSYQTAWAMLHRYRSAMVRPGRERLSGRVEADETYVGGEEPGARGRQTDKKAIVAIAVEVRDPRGFGRARLRCVPDVSAASLVPFVCDVVEPGAVVLTDGWGAYNALGEHGYTREKTVISASGDPAHVSLPAVHRIASLLKRWLLGTHQGAVGIEHLDAYLNEWTFRFNRRASRQRGLLFYRLLEQAVATDPVTYRELVVNPQPGRRRPTAPTGPRANPSSLALPRADRPWRQHTASPRDEHHKPELGGYPVFENHPPPRERAAVRRGEAPPQGHGGGPGDAVTRRSDRVRVSRVSPRRSTEMSSDPRFAIASSGLPSPSRSSAAMATGRGPTPWSRGAPKLPSPRPSRIDALPA